MTIPFRVKKLTPTAKLPHRNCKSDLWDLFADDFCGLNVLDENVKFEDYCIQEKSTEANYRESEIASLVKTKIIKRRIGKRYNHIDSLYDKLRLELLPQGRILVKTGIALELPVEIVVKDRWAFKNDYKDSWTKDIKSYAVADLRPRSGLALKHGITVLNSPATIDNSYRKEIGVILYNAGHEPYTIKKGDKIAQMLIRPLYPSSFEEVKDFEDTGRGAYGSTGK